jgi:hypothetical protein
LRLDVYLVPHGYQADFFIGGCEEGFECRDFAGTHPTPALERLLLDLIRTRLLPDFRREARKLQQIS